MNITLIAPPAAGKGTQASKIQNTYNIPHISSGDLLRNIDDKTIKEKLKDGKFVSDDIITNLLKQRLKNIDCKNGFVLDGYPRNISQAKEYQTILKQLNKKPIIIVLDIDKDIAKKRIIGRKTCPNCGEVYNDLLETKPKIKDTCNNCQTKLIKRKDDTEETWQKRYDLYLKETKPIIDYFEKQGIVYHVNSGINSDHTFSQIKQILGGLNDQH